MFYTHLQQNVKYYVVLWNYSDVLNLWHVWNIFPLFINILTRRIKVSGEGHHEFVLVCISCCRWTPLRKMDVTVTPAAWTVMESLCCRPKLPPVLLLTAKRAWTRGYDCYPNRPLTRLPKSHCTWHCLEIFSSFGFQGKVNKIGTTCCETCKCLSPQKCCVVVKI